MENKVELPYLPHSFEQDRERQEASDQLKKESNYPAADLSEQNQLLFLLDQIEVKQLRFN